MYKKLISNLPFNPSLIGQVSFYAQRIRQEEKVRRIGVFFVIISLFVQILAVIAQPEPSLASSQNDIVPGGFSSKSEAVGLCQENRYDFRDTLNHFGVSCSDLQSASREKIKSTDYDKNLLSLGRLPYGKEGERPVRIEGKTYYQRYLWSWDSWAYSTYDALVGERSDGSPFMVLYNCGNITIVETEEPKEQPYTVRSALIKGGSDGGGGQIFSGGGSFDTTHQIESNRPAVRSSSDVSIEQTNIVGVSRVRAPATIELGGDTWERQGSSHCYDKTTCRNDGVRSTLDVRSYDKKNGGYVQTYWFYERVEPEPEPQQPVEVVEPEPEPEPEPQQPVEVVDICPEIPGVQTNQADCIPCEDADNQNDTTACLVLSKSAENETQGIAEANGTTAKTGDVITYTLYVENTGDVPVDSFAVEENMGDVLEYALITNFHGGEIDDNAIVRWPEQTIDPNTTITERITIQVKDELPQTPVANSNPGSYDLTMTNVYGNTVEIELPASLPKTTEQVVQTLPNTGPGSGLVISFGVTVLVGYFFARTKLYNKELSIIRHDMNTSGGVA